MRYVMSHLLENITEFDIICLVQQVITRFDKDHWVLKDAEQLELLARMIRESRAEVKSGV